MRGRRACADTGHAQRALPCLPCTYIPQHRACGVCCWAGCARARSAAVWWYDASRTRPGGTGWGAVCQARHTAAAEAWLRRRAAARGRLRRPAVVEPALFLPPESKRASAAQRSSLLVPLGNGNWYVHDHGGREAACRTFLAAAKFPPPKLVRPQHDYILPVLPAQPACAFARHAPAAYGSLLAGLSSTRLRHTQAPGT